MILGTAPGTVPAARPGSWATLRTWRFKNRAFSCQRHTVARRLSFGTQGRRTAICDIYAHILTYCKGIIR
ncbi:hypothetical protein M419DRAFT_132346 [Trichoderma reesei RUT C-30]|uniref:Uncharacterized protein n=1 Tax=Hypocrea jecorina (strain ATCC 56765 / BCRC 32924 / NRRL 11460 / Rut C-30) TaxID=1344414 RepID=A0A024S5G3_HYPJR|nr:hypothetical protein M419DRAFT_132346 [Trichoderma reesei RUT C-30]